MKKKNFKKALKEAATWGEQLTESEHSTMMVSDARQRVLNRIFNKYWKCK